MNDKAKALVVGRHGGDLPDVEVVARSRVQFALDHEGVREQLHALNTRARAAGADMIVFEGLPPQVAAALGGGDAPAAEGNHVSWYVVIPKPAPRPPTQVVSADIAGPAAREAAKTLIMAANPRAKVTETVGGLTVTVEPPMAFEFGRLAKLK